MQKVVLAFSLIFLLTPSSPAIAASLYSADDVVFGVDSITVDPNTGLEWLDWTESTNWSFNDLANEFGSGGAFAGWRHAAKEEVTELFLNAGTTLGYHTPIDSAVLSLQSLLGITYQGGNFTDSLGLYGPPNQSLDVPFARFFVNSDTDQSFTSPEQGLSPADFSHSAYGHALVRSAVPEPSSLALLAVGLLGIGGYTSRKQRQR